MKRKKEPINIRTLLKYLIFVIILLIAFRINRKLTFITIFVIISVIVKFFKTMFSLSITFEMVLFFGIMLTRMYNLAYALIFIIVSVFGIDILTGLFSEKTIISFVAFVTTFIIADFIKLLNLNVVVYGLILTFIFSILTFFIKHKLNASIDDLVLAPTTTFVFTGLYFSLFGAMLEALM